MIWMDERSYRATHVTKLAHETRGTVESFEENGKKINEREERERIEKLYR